MFNAQISYGNAHGSPHVWSPTLPSAPLPRDTRVLRLSRSKVFQPVSRRFKPFSKKKIVYFFLGRANSQRWPHREVLHAYFTSFHGYSRLIKGWGQGAYPCKLSRRATNLTVSAPLCLLFKNLQKSRDSHRIPTATHQKIYPISSLFNHNHNRFSALLCLTQNPKLKSLKNA